MPTNNDYHFVTHWRVKAHPKEVVDVLSDAEDLPRWWPSVYLEVKQFAPGDENGLGRRVSLYTKGWLPYTLRWDFEVTDVRDDGFALTAEGDFVGRGIWTFTKDGDYTEIIYDWKIAANKPLLRDYSWIMKPIFGMNHKWAMARGYESLIIELMQRKSTTDAERERIPAPPPATPNEPERWLLAIIGFPPKPAQSFVTDGVYKESYEMKQSEQQSTDLPTGLAQPALRALHGAGIENLEQLANFTEEEIKALHGIGPNALNKLKVALEEKGMKLKER